MKNLKEDLDEDYFAIAEKAKEEKDYTKAMKYYEMAADTGNSTAMLKLGDMHWNGLGVEERDLFEAMLWYEEAADAGNDNAMFSIWSMYKELMEGIEGQKLDYQQLLECLENEDHEWAMINIGYMYAEGLGVYKDYQKALEWYEEAADRGSILAMNIIGKMYWNGVGVRQDFEQAMGWFKEAAARGNALAMARIGSMYLEGMGVNEDYQQAMDWLERAADAGNANAMFCIGAMFEEGQGTARNIRDAKYWYNEAANRGIEEAKRRLGDLENKEDEARKKNNTVREETTTRIIAEGEVPSAIRDKIQRQEKTLQNNDVIEREVKLPKDYFALAENFKKEKDYIKAMEYYRIAADAGDPRAMENIGRIYRFGWGVRQDDQQAMKWYERAFDAGNATATIAMTEIGDGYCDGTSFGCQQAMLWYKKAADAGNADAMNKIGMMYVKGLAGRDYQQAMKWYERAADTGNFIAMINIGKMYEYGFGVKQDYQQAIEWYKKATDAGYEISQIIKDYLGLADKSKKEKDYAKAIECYKIAAHVGNAPEIMVYIGEIYEQGLGMKQDNQQAIEWYKKAADAGSSIAMNRIVNIHKKEFNQIIQQGDTSSIEGITDILAKLDNKKYTGAFYKHEIDKLCKKKEELELEMRTVEGRVYGSKKEADKAKIELEQLNGILQQCNLSTAADVHSVLQQLKSEKFDSLGAIDKIAEVTIQYKQLDKKERTFNGKVYDNRKRVRVAKFKASIIPIVVFITITGFWLTVADNSDPFIAKLALSIAITCIPWGLFALIKPQPATFYITSSRWKAMGSFVLLFPVLALEYALFADANITFKQKIFLSIAGICFPWTMVALIKPHFATFHITSSRWKAIRIIMLVALASVTASVIFK